MAYTAQIATERQPLRASGEMAAPASPDGREQPSVLLLAAWHAVAWLTISNFIGVGLAVLLIWPRSGAWLGAWTYGRWMPVHLNSQLYGWCSLPLVAWLLRIYQADRGWLARWSSIALLLWSLALAIGSVSWLNGHSSGKLFLDWTGYTRVFFPLAILFLWCVLAASLARSWHRGENQSLAARASKLAGLLLLLLIPFAIYAAANPNLYPPVNPDSGGPTGASQLESVLIVVVILFVLPYGITRRAANGGRWVVTAWVTFAVEALLCLGLGRADVSNSRPAQYISLASLLLWLPLLPAYYGAFVWRPNTRRWRLAVLAWWAVLIPTGWLLFLPGVLDRLKFTDGLVGHSLLAMAGFVTSLLVLLLVGLLDCDVFDTSWSFIAWQAGTAVYIAIMFVAGWIEGADPAFTMVPNAARNVIYGLRLACGIAMTAASVEWFWRTTQHLKRPAAALRATRRQISGRTLPAAWARPT
jgi:cytochrome c oxidase cbb3-type subunit 1